MIGRATAAACLIGLLGCSGQPHEFPCHLFVDSAFSQNEKQAIKDAALAWETATDGIARFDVDDSDFGFDVGNHLVKVASVNDTVIQNRPNHKTVAGTAVASVDVGPFSSSPGIVYLVTDTMHSESDRFDVRYIDLFRVTALHELGHHIGLPHAEKQHALMFRSPISSTDYALMDSCITAWDTQVFCDLYYPDCNGHDAVPTCIEPDETELPALDSEKER